MLKTTPGTPIWKLGDAELLRIPFDQIMAGVQLQRAIKDDDTAGIELHRATLGDALTEQFKARAQARIVVNRQLEAALF